MNEQAVIVRSAAEQIAVSPTNERRILVGFDGFVDEIISVVDKRHDADHYDAITSIDDFGSRVSAAAGLSTNFEMVPQKIKLGGNGPIMANAFNAHEYAVHYIGALGEGVVHPVFNRLVMESASVTTLADPGHTHALEFDDGKIMLGKSSSLSHVNWANLLKEMPRNELATLMQSIDLLAINNWTMLPNLNDIMVELMGLSIELGNPIEHIFIDLSDPARRDDEELVEVAGLIGEMEALAKVTFGMNEKESVAVAKVLLGDERASVEDRAVALQQKLGVSHVLIHPTHSAGVATAEGYVHMEGPFTDKPKLTTGAGDNFNAGFCVGLLAGLTPQECLATGVSNSGFYVRNARSAKQVDLVDFMHRWAEVDCGDVV